MTGSPRLSSAPRYRWDEHHSVPLLQKRRGGDELVVHRCSHTITRQGKVVPGAQLVVERRRREGGGGEFAHEADVAATVDEGDFLRGEEGAEGFGGLREAGVAAETGTAEYGDGFQIIFNH